MDPARLDARGDAAPAPPSHDRRQYMSHRRRDEARYLRRGLPAATISVPAPCRGEGGGPSLLRLPAAYGACRPRARMSPARTRGEREAGEKGRGGERGEKG